MALSYNCLVDLGQQVDMMRAAQGEQALRPMFEFIRQNDEPDALYSSSDDGPVIYDIGNLVEYWEGVDPGDEADKRLIDGWIGALKVLQEQKIYLIWVNW